MKKRQDLALHRRHCVANSKLQLLFECGLCVSLEKVRLLINCGLYTQLNGILLWPSDLFFFCVCVC